ncbi:hypothetical protein BH11MYX3_BH11MYX3_08920 [soil metagenome]
MPTAGELELEFYEKFLWSKVLDPYPVHEQAIVIDQTNPTPRLRKAQALIALGRTAEGDALLQEIVNRKWHDVWSGVPYQAKSLLERGKALQRQR